MLVIDDRCYSGAFRQRGDTSIKLANMSRVQFLDEVSLRQSRNLLTSDANEQVADGSKQIPQYFPVKEGHEGGEFVFLRRP